MSEKINCPRCGAEVPFKPLGARWQYGKYEVARYGCPKCKRKFNIYSSPDNTYTIPKAR